MKKGIIIDIDDAFLTLLTPDGEFLKARKQNNPCAIGEEILFTPIEWTTRRPFSLKRLISLKPLSVAAAAILLFLGSFIPMYENNKVYAYMSIDINPSIEMELNDRMKVIKLTSYNQDGKKVLSHIGNWKKKEACDVSILILKESKREGYLRDHHSIIISTVRMERPEETAEKLLKTDLDEIERTIKENNLQLTVVTGTEKDLERAHQLGITAGKYKESKIDSPYRQSSTKQQVEDTAAKKGKIKAVNNSIVQSMHTHDVNNHVASSGEIPPIEILHNEVKRSYSPPEQRKKYFPPGQAKKYSPAGKPNRKVENTTDNAYVHKIEKKPEHIEKRPKKINYEVIKHWQENVFRKKMENSNEERNRKRA